MTEQLTENSLNPIICVYCTKFITFIEFDIEQHLVTDHHLFSSYCDTTSPTMERAIADGKRMGLKVDPTLLQQLRKNFLTHQSTTPKQYVGIHPDWIPAPISQGVIQRLQGMKSWSQSQLDKSFIFEPLMSVDRFFDQDLLPLYEHQIERSPCYPIIDFKAAGRYILYFCSLHSNIQNVNLESLEHHCKYDNAVTHREEITSRISGLYK